MKDTSWIDRHKMLEEDFCAPCIVEFVLKVYTKIDVDDFELQKNYDLKNKWGGKEIKEKLKEYGLTPHSDRFTFDELIEKTKNVDSPVIFSWPLYIRQYTTDPSLPKELGPSHMFISKIENESHLCLTYGLKKGLSEQLLTHSVYLALEREFQYKIETFWVDESPIW